MSLENLKRSERIGISRRLREVGRRFFAGPWIAEDPQEVSRYLQQAKRYFLLSLTEIESKRGVYLNLRHPERQLTLAVCQLLPAIKSGELGIIFFYANTNSAINLWEVEVISRRPIGQSFALGFYAYPLMKGFIDWYNSGRTEFSPLKSLPSVIEQWKKRKEELNEPPWGRTVVPFNEVQELFISSRFANRMVMEVLDPLELGQK